MFLLSILAASVSVTFIYTGVKYHTNISQRHTNVRKHGELKIRVYMAQEVVKSEIWAPLLKKLTTTVGK